MLKKHNIKQSNVHLFDTPESGNTDQRLVWNSKRDVSLWPAINTNYTCEKVILGPRMSTHNWHKTERYKVQPARSYEQ
jgi:hypothetical protein